MNNLPKQERRLNRIYCFYSAKCKFCVLICMQFRSFLWHWWNVMERAGIKRGEEKGRKEREKEAKRSFPQGRIREDNCERKQAGLGLLLLSTSLPREPQILPALSHQHQPPPLSGSSSHTQSPCLLPGEAQAQAGKGSHAACPAMSGWEVVGSAKLQSALWDRGCRHTHGELAGVRASEWELVSCTSCRGLGTPRMWCVCPTLGVYLNISAVMNYFNVPVWFWRQKFQFYVLVRYF